MRIEVVPARWPSPPNVHALTTTRAGGAGTGVYDSLNLAAHVGDDPGAVAENRTRLREQLSLPREPVWLRQVHGNRIVCADHYDAGEDADGSYTANPGTVCAIMTADCLPLFLCSADGSRVGLFHIGWRGLAGGLVRGAARAFSGGAQTLSWLGPAIGPGAFEIGDEVKIEIESAVQCRPDCFVPTGAGRWLADLYALTAAELEREDVVCAYDDRLCTYSDTTRFFSHRRAGPCGRMASLIWME